MPVMLHGHFISSPDAPLLLHSPILEPSAESGSFHVFANLGELLRKISGGFLRPRRKSVPFQHQVSVSLAC
jgi:hypothetical protein